MSRRYETLDLELVDGVMWVTLDRPEVHNAFNMQMIRDLGACWHDLRADDDVKVVVLTGAGERAFCTGVDRMEAIPTSDDAQPESLLGTVGETPIHFNDPGDWISPKTAGELWKPMIAAVNGMACGGAFYLLGECEFIVAAESATFFDPHTTFGMAAVFEPMMMLQRMPLGEVMRMTLAGSYERMSSKRAHEIGLVQEVVPLADLHDTVQTLAAKIASQPPLAVQATVRAIWYAQQMNYLQALEVGKTLIQLGTDPASLEEGQKAFTSGERLEWNLR